MKKFLKKNWIILIILLVGLFLRIYNYKELFLYTHDQDLAGWFVKDVVVNHHLRLIGQETSTEGIFIGAFFYYLLIPFYLLFGMDPIGGVFLVLLIGLFTIWSFYFVFGKVFSKDVGLIAALLYSVSFYTVFNDREIVPTMPVILWTVWFLWGIFLLLKGKQKFAYPFLGVLFALTWHLNVALVLLIPVVILAQFLSNKRMRLRYAFNGLVMLVLVSLPFIIFELRHNFVQTRSLIAAFTTNQQDIVSGSEKFTRTLLLFSKDIHNLLWGDIARFGYNVDLILFIAVFILLAYKKIIGRKIQLVFGMWIITYVVFFSLYSKRLSEYYLNGVVVIFIGIFSLFLAWLIKHRGRKLLGFFAIMALVLINLTRFFKIPVNRSGYVERQEITKYIEKDARDHGFPCVSVSYITDPGYDRGYRYFLWLNKVKVKPISDNVPVYTIVYPQKPVFKTDRDFGAIGLIEPEYDKYNRQTVEKSCVGDDFNLIDPMIGFTN
jgi:4-amino-4-deoxy-L-arabinose transferase-like glycosyltransferase